MLGFANLAQPYVSSEFLARHPISWGVHPEASPPDTVVWTAKFIHKTNFSVLKSKEFSMSMPRRFARAIACCIWGFCLGLLLLTSAAGAETARYSILLDTDHNPATGCTVATVAGNFAGVEQRLVTTVTFDTNTAKVKRCPVAKLREQHA